MCRGGQRLVRDAGAFLPKRQKTFPVLTLHAWIWMVQIKCFFSGSFIFCRRFRLVFLLAGVHADNVTKGRRGETVFNLAQLDHRLLQNNANGVSNVQAPQGGKFRQQEGVSPGLRCHSHGYSIPPLICPRDTLLMMELHKRNNGIWVKCAGYWIDRSIHIPIEYLNTTVILVSPAGLMSMVAI